MEAAHLPEPLAPGIEHEPDMVAGTVPELTLIDGGLQETETVASRHLPFEEFAQGLQEADWANMSHAQLMEVRARLSDYLGETNALMVGLTTDMFAVTQKITWLNGFIKDRQP
jgi:hypothetical protein